MGGLLAPGRGARPISQRVAELTQTYIGIRYEWQCVELVRIERLDDEAYQGPSGPADQLGGAGCELLQARAHCQDQIRLFHVAVGCCGACYTYCTEIQRMGGW